MKQTITKKWLEEKGACQKGIDKFVNLKEKRVDVLVKMAIKGRNYIHLEWADWLLNSVLNTKEEYKYNNHAEYFWCTQRGGKELLRYGLKIGAKK